MNMACRLFLCACLVLGSVALPMMIAAPVYAQSCTELITDGGFEAGGAWQLGASPVPAQYVTYTRHSGNQSLALGITSGANVQSYSSARQTVTIPAGTTQATLSFWFYAMADSPATTDYMEVVLLDATGTAILDKLWYSHNDSRLWNQLSFDLTPWRGQAMQVYFNVYNDGLGGKAAMFVDDVSLQACTSGATVMPTGTPTVTPTGTPPVTLTPTVTPTSTPGCISILVNGDFSSGLAAWQIPSGALGVGLVTSPVHSAPSAVKLGSLEENLDGLAWIRQLVTIPAGYTQVTLGAWIYTESQTNPGNDYQQIDLLDSSGNPISPSSPIWKGDPPQNNPAWQPLSFNLLVAAGQSVFVRFSVFNDGAGGRTDMVVDDITLTACVPGPGATATATSLPTGTPTLPATPLPTSTGTPPATGTPVTPGCIDLLQNNGFEAGWDHWYVPSNPLLPQIVTSPVFGGTFAAELGSQIQNANSYSSVRQWVTLPPDRPRVVLSYWAYTWAESLSGADRQQLVLLRPDDSVLAVPWSVLENEQTWGQHVFDLIDMAGQTLAVYFNVINDGTGGRTAMFVDEAHLWACTADAYPDSLISSTAATTAGAADASTAASAPEAAAAASVATVATEAAPAAASAAVTVPEVTAAGGAAPGAVETAPAITGSAPAARAAVVATPGAATLPPPDVTRVSLEPSGQTFTGTVVPGIATTAGAGQSSPPSLIPSGSLKWLGIILIIVLVVVVIWLLFIRPKP